MNGFCDFKIEKCLVRLWPRLASIPFPTEHFAILEPQYPLVYVFLLHKIRTDFEALEKWNARSSEQCHVNIIHWSPRILCRDRLPLFSQPPSWPGDAWPGAPMKKTWLTSLPGDSFGTRPLIWLTAVGLLHECQRVCLPFIIPFFSGAGS